MRFPRMAHFCFFVMCLASMVLFNAKIAQAGSPTLPGSTVALDNNYQVEEKTDQDGIFYTLSCLLNETVEVWVDDLNTQLIHVSCNRKFVAELECPRMMSSPRLETDRTKYSLTEDQGFFWCELYMTHY